MKEVETAASPSKKQHLRQLKPKKLLLLKLLKALMKNGEKTKRENTS